ncbi:hypothetical protein MRB53_009958 [Persea americana]|uniref:Uncharacterized protein n=1 Tax=Persea americana TaxID=3435 RepID=A0ACC2LRN4_PERAE|nr:hypothetical protein MRB53_009958 [Persea americana]
MNPKSSSSTKSTTTFDNLYFSLLNPTPFITAHNITLKSIRSFIKLMMEEMATASWDIDAAADSIEPDTRKAMEIFKENPMSEFGRFCKLKYLSVVHPEKQHPPPPHMKREEDAVSPPS